MKAIKLLYIMILLFSIDAISQTVKKDRFNPRYHNLRYTIMFPETSPDGKWTAFRKTYEESRDTIVLVDRKKAENVKQYAGVTKFYFTGRSNLLLIRKGSAEMINLNSGVSKSWNQIVSSEFVKSQNTWLVLRGTSSSGTDLEIWKEGDPADRYKNVTSFFVKGSDVFFVKKEAGKNLLYDLRMPEKAIYSTDQKILDCRWSDKGGSAWITEKNGKTDLVYISKTQEAFHLSSDTSRDFKAATISRLGTGERFLVRLTYGDDPDKLPGNPDIWNADDRKLELKFHGGESEEIAVWDPKLRSLRMDTDDKALEKINIGDSMYVISYNYYKNQDYVNQYPEFDLYRYEVGNGKQQYIGKGGYILYYGSTGRFILSNPGNNWVLYDLYTLAEKKLKIADTGDPYFSEDDQYILFETEGRLLRYQTDTGDLVKISLLDGFRSTIVNPIQGEGISGYPNGGQNLYNSKEPLIIKMYDKKNDLTAILSYSCQSGKKVMLQAPTRERIDKIEHKNGILLEACIEDYNVPAYIKVFNGLKAKIIYKSNRKDMEVGRIRSERISYKNSEGVDLTGILYYPLDFTDLKRYPMITIVYARQSHFGNQYLRDGFFERTEGLNIRSYLEGGYFVFLPDIVFDKRGTGFSALDCVNSALDAVAGLKSIDFKRLGLIGYSHGGYETNFIATHSDRFKAYASGAGNSDLVRSYFSYNYNFLRPFYWQFENGQYKMPGSFKDYKELYIQNSPIYSVSEISAPIFLWTGVNDRNIDWNQVMEFYIGLKRNKKEVVALFYQNEAHGFLKRSNKIDIARRVEQWFEYHLKDGIKADWMKGSDKRD
ncbi:prolyl oligopeptidase active site domain protein [Chryseobacterium sp. StRB126]|uniref:alpha/beta hydrolase family protein n=1 Tax=Chryseobacterium sp. StRB126 TaxID=878220 RepID=UPI0004E9972F|nr:prolyl oligopeptidase family serine peptidase [Chryseobacterium sp. StRB126]BAP31072.1 prolyl oligopeptidase active site domain protein [Chryseobacterium sp. StRB126]